MEKKKACTARQKLEIPWKVKKARKACKKARYLYMDFMLQKYYKIYFKTSCIGSLT